MTLDQSRNHKNLHYRSFLKQYVPSYKLLASLLSPVYINDF